MAQIFALHADGNLALFEQNGSGVVLNTSTLDVFDPQPINTFRGKSEWQPVAPGYSVPNAWAELASAAVSSLDVASTTAGGGRGTGGPRTFRIPKGVSSASSRALQRLGDNAPALGVKLAKGDCVTLDEAREIKELLEAKPDANTYALFGGSTGLRWSTNLVDKNSEPISAAGEPPVAEEPVAEEEWVDPDQPHDFVEFSDDPTLCAVCQRAQDDPIHVVEGADEPAPVVGGPEEDRVGATAPAPADVPVDAEVPPEDDPDAPHAFAPDPDDPTMCIICARDEGDPVHLPVEPTAPSAPVTAAGFEYDDEAVYFGVKKNADDDDTSVIALLMLSQEETWSEWRQGAWVDVPEPTTKTGLIELDQESANTLANAFNDTNTKEVALQSLGTPEEWEMWFAAESGIDWEAVDRVFDTYDPMERSVNAKKQTRAGDGRFGSGGGSGGSSDSAPAPASGDGAAKEKPAPKARLSTSLPLVEDVKALIDDYVANAVKERARASSGAGDLPPEPLQAATPPPAPPVDAAPAAEGDTPSAPTPETSDIAPLYLAIVDEADTQAVVDLIALVPGTTPTELGCYKRDNGAWVRDENYLRELRGSTPPPVVQLDEATLADVLTQMDPGSDSDEEEGDIAGDGAPIMSSAVELSTPSAKTREKDAKRGYALPDGSFPIRDERDLEKAIKASGRASDQAEAKKHIKKRARALGRTDLVPDDWKTAAVKEPRKLWDENGEIIPLAAGGVPGIADTPGDIKNVERLKRYWSHGEGAAKIQWGVPGDFKRCVKQVRKYMGTRAEGYCALRHKEATGTWPGHSNKGRNNSIFEIRNEESYEAITAAVAQAYADLEGVTAPDTAEEAGRGGKFRIPMLIPEGVSSGDGREFVSGSLSHRDLPIPLYWQIKTDEGHTGSVIVGRIDEIHRLENGLGDAHGVFDSGPFGREAERLVREKFLRGISADLDNFEAEVKETEQEGKLTSAKMEVSSGRVMAATLVGKPAFQECFIEMEDENTAMDEEAPVSDGVYEEDRPLAAAAEHALAALAASAAPATPPADWFDNPQLQKPTALTVTDDGRVYGHIAAWDVDHIGMPFGTRPPKSRSGYAYFQTGLLRTDAGKDVRVGQLTLAGGHAPLQADAQAAVKHYDDTASAVADVSAGEDVFGIWVAGALRPSVTPEQVRALRASAPSGDWRPINGALELVAVCQVNVPGFPIARTMVAGGQVMALVAAGASVLAHLREQPLSTVEARIAALEAFENKRLREQQIALAARMRPVLEEHDRVLTSRMAKAREAFAPYLAAEEEMTAQVEALRERVFGLKVMPKFEEQKHPRDDEGKFRKVFARLIESLGDVPDMETKEAVKEIEKAADQEESGDSQAAEETAKAAKAHLDDIAEQTDDIQVEETARDAARQVSEAVSEAIDAGDEGIAFGDLPPEIQDLINKAIDNFLQQPVQGGLGALESRLKEWATGDGFASPEDIARLIAQYLTEQVRPQ